jgi:exodeoxyribonuclease VII large subunit
VLVRDAAGLPVRRAADAAAAQGLSLQFADGTVEAVPAGGVDPAPADRTPRPAGTRSSSAPGRGTGGRTAAKAAAPVRQGSLFDA